MTRIGVLGGSFNPPHLAHLQAAEIAAAELGLDRVLLIPCGTPAHKQLDRDPGQATRLALTNALASTRPDLLDVDDLEFHRPGPSYTADTITILRDRHPDIDLHLIIGFDQTLALPSWADISRLLATVTVTVIPRPQASSCRPVISTLQSLRARYDILTRAPDRISSTMIRRDIAAGGSAWRQMTPPPVAELIDRLGLYQPATRPTTAVAV